MTQISWARKHAGGYECSSRGDTRFSAFSAMIDPGRGRSIEHVYQCDIKGYDPGGRNWQLGKGKPPIYPWPPEEQWLLYKNLWKLYLLRNPALLPELHQSALEHGGVLTDMFATSDINQARALAEILNEWLSYQQD